MDEKIAVTKKKSIPICIFEWVITMICYALVLAFVSCCFKSLYIDLNYYGIYALVAVVIIYILNRTIKPILFALTLPITGLTLGLFYPVLNVIILKLTDWILLEHFELTNLWIAFFIAILISVMNILIDEILIKPLMRRMKKHE